MTYTRRTPSLADELAWLTNHPQAADDLRKLIKARGEK